MKNLQRSLVIVSLLAFIFGVSQPLAALASDEAARFWNRRDLVRILDARRDGEAVRASDAGAVPVDLTTVPRDSKLGATVEGGRTVFRLFSPRASSVTLFVYETAAGPAMDSVAMTRRNDGVWEASLPGARYGLFYDYAVDGPTGPGELFDPEVHVSDPYARANVNHDGRSIVVDTRFDWGNSGFRRVPLADIVVYEMHVKDYTAHASSGVAGARRGKYLGLLEGAGTDRVLGNLTELGVNAVELLPVHEFDNGASPTGTNHWGYMTSHYGAPETSYASGATGQAVAEFKALVKGLHAKGIAVILDVVYNHTTEGNEQGPTLNLKGIDNKLYYRLTPDFFYWNGTGCGNELATENPAVRRLVVDTLKRWVDEYRVDGFRFDLAAGIDRPTLMAIADELPSDVYLIAEPWTADWNRRFWDKGDLRGTKWTSWNDDYKRAVRGFVTAGCDRDALITAMAGSCFTWTAKPTETVNFIECHDNDTMDDMLRGDLRANRLAMVTLLTSQGVPMLHEGQEFAKNKKGNANSYDQDNAVNYIDWSRKTERRGHFDFVKGLMAIRARFPQLRSDRPLTDADVTWIRPDDGRCLGIRYAPRGGKPALAVLLNGSPDAWCSFQLPAGTWTVLCDGESADADGLRTAQGDYKVPPRSGVILAGPSN